MSKRIKYSGKCFDVEYLPSFLTKEEADALYQHTEHEVDWVRSPSFDNKRSSFVYGDKDLTYEVKFGGYFDKKTQKYREEWITERRATEWSLFPSDALRSIKERLEKKSKHIYNFCVIQRYPHGGVGINRHADKEMVEGSTITGLSLGSKRVIRFTPSPLLKKYNMDPFELALDHGSVYMMKPPTNQYWMHEITKDDSTEPRLSLTFRNVPVIS